MNIDKKKHKEKISFLVIMSLCSWRYVRMFTLKTSRHKGLPDAVMSLCPSVTLGSLSNDEDAAEDDA